MDTEIKLLIFCRFSICLIEGNVNLNSVLKNAIYIITGFIKPPKTTKNFSFNFV